MFNVPSTQNTSWNPIDWWPISTNANKNLQMQNIFQFVRTILAITSQKSKYRRTFWSAISEAYLLWMSSILMSWMHQLLTLFLSQATTSFCKHQQKPPLPVLMSAKSKNTRTSFCQMYDLCVTWYLFMKSLVLNYLNQSANYC